MFSSYNALYAIDWDRAGDPLRGMEPLKNEPTGTDELRSTKPVTDD